LVDLGLPGIGGLQLQQELDRRKIRLPVIMMTGRLDDAARDEATSAGAFGYLTKPFAPDALIDMIEHALAANL
jgi:FixJ family two-component response regulator